MKRAMTESRCGGNCYACYMNTGPCTATENRTQSIAALIVLDAAETAAADPHHKDTICINADVLEALIVERLATAAVHASAGKYDIVLRPFIALMERELHANSGKGDRPGWLSMSRETAMLEIWHHVAKLQKAALNDDTPAIQEHSADVANMSMMLLDVCGALPIEARGEER